jgi:hypothetical protein
MHIFNCDSRWPLCLHDFTFKNRIPNYFCFKTRNSLSELIINDYFSKERFENWRNFKRQPLSETQGGDLLIERHEHSCCQDKKFIAHYKKLFNTQDWRLLEGNEIFIFQINDELEMLRKLDMYYIYIKNLDLSDF